MTRRTATSFLLGMAVFVALVYGATPTVEAAPPAPVIYTITQPDNTSFPARNAGDEWDNWVETMDGYSVTRNTATGYWEYARVGAREEVVPGLGRVWREMLAPSGLVVGRDSPHGLPRHAAPRNPRPPQAPPYQRKAEGVDAAPTRPRSGIHKTMLLRVAFTNQPLLSDEAEWASALFSDVGPTANLAVAEAAVDTARPSLKRYWMENSYNSLILQAINETSGVAHNGIVQVALNYTHPNTTTTGITLQQVARDALVAADAYVDFAALDVDGDGVLSNDEVHIIIVLAGAEAAFGNACNMNKVWAHHTGLWQVTAPTLDNKSVGRKYSMVGEMHCSGDTAPGHMATIGVIAHELGHDMGSGVPDLYDTNGGSEGIGRWGLQGNGSWNNSPTSGLLGTHPAHSSAWEKWLLGLLTPTKLAPGRATVSLEAVTTSTAPSRGVVQVLDNPADVETRGTGEYFLLENRQRLGFDVGLPGDGVLIWHIDESMSGNTDQGTAAPGGRRLVALVQADGQYGLECFSGGQCNRGDVGDPWRNSPTGLQPTGSPNSALWDGTPSNVAISEISASASLMTAVVSVPQPPAAPSSLQATATTCNQVNLTWSDNTTDEQGFLVYRNATLVAQVAANVTAYQDTATSATTTYAYVVKTMRGGQESAGSNTASLTTPACLPDLRPHTPAGYAAPVVPASVTGTTTSTTLYAGRPTYFDLYFSNSGKAVAQGAFYVEFWVDTIRVLRYQLSNMGYSGYTYFTDWNTTVQTPGWHTVRLVIDPDNTIAESDETNNVWQGQFYWEGGTATATATATQTRMPPTATPTMTATPTRTATPGPTPIATPTRAATFTDVPLTDWAWSHVEAIYQVGITTGCITTTPLYYCPTTLVSRDQMAVFFVRAKYGRAFIPPAATGVFSDVPVNDWAAAHIEQAYRDGIVTACGTSPLRFCPTSPIPRDLKAQWLLLAKHGGSYAPPTPTQQQFADVPLTHPYAAWINQLFAEGVTTGCVESANPTTRQYCPNTTIDRAQMAVFLVRLFNLPRP